MSRLIQKLAQQRGDKSALCDPASDMGSGLGAKPGEVAAQQYYPLTQTQYGILAESLSHPDSTVYNVPFL